MRNRILLTSVISVLLLAAPAVLRSQPAKVIYITYPEARPVLEALADILPVELRAANDLSSKWANWVARRDAEIRSRVAQGDEDSLVNFLMFGTSFTRRPRITLKDLAEIGEKHLLSSGRQSPESAAFVRTIETRADDLIEAMNKPDKNERLLFARQLMTSKSFDIGTSEGRERVKRYLISSLARVLNEHSGYAKVLESARLLGDPSAEFAERSKLYATRGLSSDTSLLPNFALERSLASLRAQGVLTAASVRRIGIIGPGLDFTDKQDGYDFYPQQTIQPFAVIDSLLRLGLSGTQLKITTLDLSPRVNDHLRRAIANARRSIGYTIQLPRDQQAGWKPEVVAYWEKFGDRIGAPATPVTAPAGLGDLRIRAIRVKPAFVAMITPEDVDIVLQHVENGGQGFDLLIATNIFVYYDVFEQSLALANVEKMLRPGGILLSNNALLELPSSRMHSIGYETVIYSGKPNDGDHIVWYQKSNE